ncbi:STAS domain-containing protein [Magnetococcus sp. PR-3]|uniref:STAS domain-containing protein n=1 Tax=Magnetococcus sp. PR-3 TaxID=3120355 RepID=UPI002FCE1E32
MSGHETSRCFKLTRTADQIKVHLNVAPTFSQSGYFLDLARSIPADSTVTIDCEQVNYLDSTGLGVLLLFQEVLVKVKRPIQLHNVHAPVRRLLQTAHFHNFFAYD